MVRCMVYRVVTCVLWHKLPVEHCVGELFTLSAARFHTAPTASLVTLVKLKP